MESSQVESQPTARVDSSDDPVWKEIRGVRRELAVMNRRTGRPKDVSPQTNTEVIANAEVTRENTPSPDIGQVESKPARKGFSSIFLKWRE